MAVLALTFTPVAAAAPPNVRPTAGSYASQTPIEIGFVSDEPVTIRYTLDNSTPSASSPLYTQGTPVRITRIGTTTLRWLATDVDGETASGTEYYTVDPNPPTITISAPTQGATFIQYSTGNPAAYSCADAELSYVTCVGTVPVGSSLDTSTSGQKTFTVVATDAAGNRTERSVTYTVYPATQGNGSVTGNVPATLSLSMGSAPSFGPFVAGVDREYTSSTVATVLSTAGNATLAVSDPSSFATGHLVNGTFFLPQRLQASGGGAFAPVGGSSAPTVLKTYNAPITNDMATVNFKQVISRTDALRTGAYNKTLTFTLSTTQP